MALENYLIPDKINRAVVVYSCVCLMYQVANVITPVNFLFKTLPFSLFSPALAVIGLALAVADVRASGMKYAVRGARWLYVFLIVALISTLVSYQYGFIENIKVLIWSYLQISVIATFAAMISESEKNRVFQMLHLYASVLYVPVLLYMFFRFHTLEDYLLDDGVFQGWHEGRLFGIFFNLYDGTLIAAFLALATLVRFVQCKSRIGKSVLVFEEIVCWVYVFLSGTRTIYAGLMAAWAVAVCLYFRHRYLAGRQGMLSCFTAGIAVFLLSVLLMAGVGQGIRSGFIVVSSMTCEIRADCKEINGLTHGKIEDIPRLIKEKERPEEVTSSSRRMTIWRNYFEILFDKPSHLLIGMSPEGKDAYLYDRYADNYVVAFIKEAYPVAYRKRKVYATHNAYLHVLVTTGVFGFAAVMLFLIRFLADSWKFIWSGKVKEKGVVPFLAVTMLLVMCLFETDVFLKATPGSFVFWTVFGYMSTSLIDREKGKCMTSSPC